MYTTGIQLRSFCDGQLDSKKFITFVHLPSEAIKTVMPSKNSFEFNEMQSLNIKIKPKMIVTEHSLKRYTIEERQCYYENEKQLRYFRSYSKHNCETECLSNYTMHFCGCVSFFMLRDAHMKVCDASSMNKSCDYSAAQRFQSNYYEVDKSKIDCKCLPACTSLEYEIEISEIEIVSDKSIVDDVDITSDVSDRYFEVNNLRFSYAEIEFQKLIKVESYNILTFFFKSIGLFGELELRK